MSHFRTGRKADLNRRARTAVVFGLACFVVGQAGFRLALAWWPSIGDREFGQKLADLRTKRDESPGRPLLLMVGSSRVATGFRPDTLPQVRAGEVVAFNFAQLGTGPQLAHLLLHRLLTQGVKPDWVFVEFWAPFWGTDGYLKGYTDPLNLAALDWPAARLLAGYLPKPKHLLAKWIPAQIAPIFASRFALLSRLGSAWAPNFDPDRRLQNLDASGWWAPRATISDADRMRLVEHYRGVYQERLTRFQVRATPDRAIQNLLSLCRREGIKVAIVVLPEAADFRALYPAASRQAVDAYLARLARETTVIDARDWVANDGFTDGHHLLPTGAAAFTERFGKDALTPLLRGETPAVATHSDLDRVAR